MGVDGFLMLLPLIIKAAQTIPEIKDLIDRVNRGEQITQAEVDSAMSDMDAAVDNFDNTPSG